MDIFFNIEEFLQSNLVINNFGKLGSKQKDTISFISKKNHVSLVKKNPNVVGLIILEELAQDLGSIEHIKFVIFSKNVQDDFFGLYVQWVKDSKLNIPASISKSAQVHPTAVVAINNVTIGKNVIIEPYVVIHEGVFVGDDTIIRSGCILGGEGFEATVIRGVKKIVPHNGRVLIGKNVEIQSGCLIDKGIFGEDTVISDSTKLDNGVHVGHNTCIGQNCLLAARVVLSGNVTIKDDVYIGPSSTISNRVTINQEARVSIGSTVVQDVLPQEEVSGHFAIPHKLYLKQKAWLKKITKGRKS